MPKSRTLEWVATGLILALLLVVGVVTVAQPRPIFVALGLEDEGGEPTIAPTVFPEPPASEVPPDSAELVPPAATTEAGPAPDRSTLEARLDAMDTSELVDQEGNLATVSYQVLDVASGEVVASRNAGVPLIPASNTKTLTVAAAMNAFDGDERFTTSVLAPDESSIVLVGEGDPLLLSEPAEAGTYPQPPSLRELAESTAETLKAEGRTQVTLGFDASYFEGDGWAETWPEGYRTQVTEISALWADEGRVDGARSRTPALAAAQRFAEQLGELGIDVTGEIASAEGTGEEIAAVESLPMHVIVEQAMQRSNNSFTEVIGFQLAKRTGHPASFEGSTAAIREQLEELGLWEDAAHLDDASGLSRTNHFTAGLLAEVNLHLLTEPRLTAIIDGLPVAGVTGTLAERFSDETAAPARGVARAKTGTLSFVSSLAGYTTTADGALVAFAVIANGQTDGWLAKTWEDRVAGIVTGCGC